MKKVNFKNLIIGKPKIKNKFIVINTENEVFNKKIVISNNAIILKNNKKDTMKNTFVNFHYVKCNRCNFLIGLLLREKYYFIKSMIKIRKEKEIFSDLISIKEDLLNQFKSIFNLLYQENVVNVKINTHLIKKDSSSFQEYTKKNFDIIIIIHKIEGRIFLLGNNGYYNNVIKTLKSHFQNNIFFVLLVKEDNNLKNKKMIEELIEKGGEEDLKPFYENERIIFINNYNYKEGILNSKDFWIKIIHNNYLLKPVKKEFFENESKEAYNNDKLIIDQMANYLINKEDNFINRCFN